jgi:site-specific recombinase XerD
MQRTINPDLWDSAAGQASGKSKESKEINEFLEHIRFKIHDYRRELEQDNRTVTAAALRNKYTGLSDEGKYLLAVFDEHNDNCRQLMGKDFAPGTVERYKTTRKHLYDFISSIYKSSDILFNEIDHKFIRDFEFYLKTKRNCCHNTAVKYIKNFKKIILYALANDWIRVNPFKNIKYHLDDVDMPFLEEKELATLREKQFGNVRIQRVKDIFVFCCFTGLAYSDVKSLQQSHLVEKSDNDTWIIKKRDKTGIKCNIPLLQPAMDIINRYKDDPICIEKKCLLPVLTNQKMNVYLKEIADVCGINKELSTHCARHTFATTVTLSNNIPIEVVSNMLGHTSINMTKKYARVIDSQIKMNMDKVKLIYPGNK